MKEHVLYSFVKEKYLSLPDFAITYSFEWRYFLIELQILKKSGYIMD